MDTDRASNAAMLRSLQATADCSFACNDRLLITKELERALASPGFRNSKRYASVLRYIVDQTLNNPDLQLKERTIGVEVFGREPDYDTATDHVVRSALAEIRRRLTQYYQDEGATAELRIELQPGCYIPHFRHGSVRPIESNQPQLQLSSRLPVRSVPLWQAHKWIIAGLAVALTVALASVVATRRNPMERFWAPLLSSNRPVLICVGNSEGGRQASTDPLATNAPINLVQYHELDSQMILMGDAVTLANIVGFVKTERIPYRIESQSQARYADLQAGPTILIGLMNNDWTERLVSNLRFSVAHPTPYGYFIRDRDNPSNTSWSVDYSVPYLKLTKDYALIVRAADPQTGQMVMTIAGVSVFGTLAAGQFVTDPKQVSKIDAIAPRGWEKKNMEIVLSTDVIRGDPGPPVIVAARFW